jgi:hypothetical protein
MRRLLALRRGGRGADRDPPVRAAQPLVGHQYAGARRRRLGVRRLRRVRGADRQPPAGQPDRVAVLRGGPRSEPRRSGNPVRDRGARSRPWIAARGHRDGMAGVVDVDPLRASAGHDRAAAVSHRPPSLGPLASGAVVRDRRQRCAAGRVRVRRGGDRRLRCRQSARLRAPRAGGGRNAAPRRGGARVRIADLALPGSRRRGAPPAQMDRCGGGPLSRTSDPRWT